MSLDSWTGVDKTTCERCHTNDSAAEVEFMTSQQKYLCTKCYTETIEIQQTGSTNLERMNREDQD